MGFQQSSVEDLLLELKEKILLNQDNSFSQKKPPVCTPKVELKEGCGLRKDVECDTYTTGERICTIKSRPENLRFMEGHMTNAKEKQNILNTYSDGRIDEDSRNHFAAMRARRKEGEEYKKQQEESKRTSTRNVSRTEKVSNPSVESTTSMLEALRMMDPNYTPPL